MSAVTEADDLDVAIAEAAARFGRRRYARPERYRMTPALRRFDAERWSEMAALGWLGLAAPEDQGGLGLQIGGICALAHAAGTWNINEPLLSTACASDVIRLCASSTQRSTWLPPLLEGRLRIACAFSAGASGGGATLRAGGGKLSGLFEVVPDADLADILLVEAGAPGQSCWHAVDAKGARVEVAAYALADGRGAATVTMDGVFAEPLPNGDPSSHSPLLAALATSADSVGAMETAFALTLEHIKTRRQFGAPLASHQVVVHRCVDMYLRLQECRALLAQATRAFAGDGGGAANEVHAAKAFIGPQARLVAQDAVQLHGGIGITEEGAVSHCLRRTLVNEQIHGTPREHLKLFTGTRA